VGKTLVSDISVKVYKGEVLAIVGQAGGKSSFLRLLNRLDEPTGGTVAARRPGLREIAPRELRRRIGMVMQTPFLFPGTVADNIAYGPRQRGETTAQETDRALLGRVGLPGYGELDGKPPIRRPRRSAYRLPARSQTPRRCCWRMNPRRPSTTLPSLGSEDLVLISSGAEHDLRHRHARHAQAGRISDRKMVLIGQNWWRSVPPGRCSMFAES